MNRDRRVTVAAAMHQQAGWCRGLGSSFTASVLEQLASLIAQGLRIPGLTAAPTAPVADAVPLRLAAAMHALVLADACPELVALYPPRAEPAANELREALAAALEAHGALVQSFLVRPPQTNEVGRSAVLLAGFLYLAARTSLPLRLLEIGASAGLNLIWDRYSVLPRRPPLGRSGQPAATCAALARGVAGACGADPHRKPARLRSFPDRSRPRSRPSAPARLCLGRPKLPLATA